MKQNKIEHAQVVQIYFNLMLMLQDSYSKALSKIILASEMENLKDIHVKISISTNDLTTEILQYLQQDDRPLVVCSKYIKSRNLLQKLKISEVQNFVSIINRRTEILIEAQKTKKVSKDSATIWHAIIQALWSHLQIGPKKIDDHLLCATCFYTVLNLIDNQEYYFHNILNNINEEIRYKEQHMECSDTLKVVAIMYGIFQSGFLGNIANNNQNITNILNSSFKLLILMAYEYTRYTFLVFKIINSFKRVCETKLQDIIFSNDNQIKLLNLVNHNWENSITGVRELNKNIFGTLVSVMDKQRQELVIAEIDDFVWNKAKYLMISEIIEKNQKEVIAILNSNDWVDGLIYSLRKPGLVSAGADMYFAILKKLKSEDDWCNIFLPSIINILKGSCKTTVQNFTNYWYLTTLKKYPSIMNIIVSELVNQSDPERHNYLCILKQGNKLGLVDKKWDVGISDPQIKIIFEGLEYCDTRTRMLAFEIVCLSQSKSMPSKLEYELVYNFVHHNINSDCTVLRINMLSSLKSFLISLHSSFQTFVKGYSDTEMKNLILFCKKIQEFIIFSLECNGNYQRKITSIKLCNIFIHALEGAPKKKQQSKQTHVTFSSFLMNKGVWFLSDETFITTLIHYLKDPAEDVRANVVQLLLAHYCIYLRKNDLIKKLTDEAFNCIASRYFFQISCAQSMLKLIINILIKDHYGDESLKGVKEIFDFGCSQLIAEYKVKRGVLETIETGKQLHSFMSIIQSVLEVCLHNSYKFSIENDTMILLLEIMEGVANQFVWDENDETSSDFSTMSNMVKDIIKESPLSMNDDKDLAKISGLEQSVLNCLWFNVKATCNLSSLIIRYNNETTDKNICERCLNIITHVLETSRHKGAIEAAGAALGLSILRLTSLPEESDISELPFLLLKRKLNDLVSETSKMASITRRGAGLSIMVHRIVSNDATKGKSLFHYFMKIILKKCKTTDISQNLYGEPDIDNEKDLPKAIYIHFLTRIVTDSSLASDVMYYSACLAEIAFDNLTSPHWQIRNAALQLYGALVPKLIGQKKLSGTDEETIMTVACDEFRTHSPKLWKFIVNQLLSVNYVDKSQSHLNLIPILNILANNAKRYNFSYNMFEQKELDTNLLQSLMLLLNSSIYVVRRLTARCIFNQFTFQEIYESLIKQKIFTENCLHGAMVLLQNCQKFYCSNSLYQDMFRELRNKFNDIFKCTRHSYVTKAVFEDVFDYADLNVNSLVNTLSELDKNVSEPGVFYWANRQIHKYLKNVSWHNIPEVLKILLDQRDFNNYFEILLEKIETHSDNKVLIEVAIILYSFKGKYYSGVIWNILYEISLRTELHMHLDMTDTYKYIEKNCVTHKFRYIIPFASRMATNTRNENILITLSNIIFSLSNPEKTIDSDLRYIAAVSNNEFAFALPLLPDKIKVSALMTEIILLQDENDYVRNKSVDFYSNITLNNIAMNPCICLHKFLEYQFLNNLFSEPETGIQLLCEELTIVLKEFNDSKVDDYNPFANDAKNIYFEAEMLYSLVEKLKVYTHT